MIRKINNSINLFKTKIYQDRNRDFLKFLEILATIDLAVESYPLSGGNRRTVPAFYTIISGSVCCGFVDGNSLKFINFAKTNRATIRK